MMDLTAMMEILFLFGALGWLLGSCWEYLGTLDAFPTILVAFAAVPLISCADYLATLYRFELEGLDAKRGPVPPERFYWGIHKSQLRRSMAWSGPASVAAWAAAVQWPAAFVLNPVSITGWLTGAWAIVATARFIASSVVYVRASQWFDKMAPWAVGFCRRTMYRLSENPDFLGPENPTRKEKEKSIY